MANEVLEKLGKQFLFADHSADFGSAPATGDNSLIIGTPTDVQIDLTDVAGSGTARQSTKSATLGATRGARWACSACIEFATAPTDGGAVEFFWAASPSATAATGNPGGVTGADSTFSNTTGNLGQFQKIGGLLVRADTLNIGFVGIFEPIYEYGSLIVLNQTDQAFASSMDETHITLNEIIDEIQD